MMVLFNTNVSDLRNWIVYLNGTVQGLESNLNTNISDLRDQVKQPNKLVYRALGNPTRGKVTSQSDCRR